MYKQQRQNDDRNQPLSVQPWGNDGDKRRYWLIEGLDDTPFRLYRESNPALKHVTWRSVAGSIEDLRLVATKLDEEGNQASRRLRDSIQSAIPRFEAGEDVGHLHHAFSMDWKLNFLETQTTRIPNGTQSTIHTPGSRVLALRRPHPWEEDKVHLLRRRRQWVRCLVRETIKQTIGRFNTG